KPAPPKNDQRLVRAAKLALNETMPENYFIKLSFFLQIITIFVSKLNWTGRSAFD
mgnify:CR=1